MTAADRHPQIGVPFAVDPADRRGVMASLEGFEAAQPAHGLPPRQTRHRRCGVKPFRQGQGMKAPEGGGDRRVQMDQVAVAGQSGVPGPAGQQA